MPSVLELAQRVAEREKVLAAVERQSRAKVREAETKVSKGAQDNLRLRRAQEQELVVLKAHFEKSLRDAAFQSRRRVEQAKLEQSMAEGEAECAEARLRAAETNLQTLTVRMAELQAYLDKRCKVSRDNNASLERLLDIHASRAADHGRRRVDSMQMHAWQALFSASTAADEDHPYWARTPSAARPAARLS